MRFEYPDNRDRAVLKPGTGDHPDRQLRKSISYC